MSDWYTLDKNNKPVKSTVLVWDNIDKRRVALDEIEGIQISTVFLGLDHSWGSGPPVLWETMIFGGEHDNDQDRYTSHEDALIGHKHAVDLVLKSLEPKTGRKFKSLNS